MRKANHTFLISVDEIKVYLKKLKDKKAIGEDEILDEMLKSWNKDLLGVQKCV